MDWKEIVFLLISACGLFADLALGSSELLMVQTVFRHGRRAPATQFATDEAKTFFFRGLGHLTDEGYLQAEFLGKLLRERYVNNSFLDGRMLPNQILFRSSDAERCLITAQMVGRGMFPNFAPAVFTTPEEDDYLLRPKLNCPGMIAEMQRAFDVDSSQLENQELPLLVFTGKAMEAAYNQTKSIRQEFTSKITSLIIEKEAGVAVPSWFNEEASKEAYLLLYHAISVMSGTGPYKRASWIKPKSGFFLNTLMFDIRQKVECLKNPSLKQCGKIRKFYAYSTHDIVLMPLLESLGAREAAVGVNAVTDYCSTLVIELWLINDHPAVKVLYRRSPDDEEFTTVTEYITGCPAGEQFCNAEKFTSCCDEFITTSPKAECWGAPLDWNFNALSYLLVGVIALLIVLSIFLVWKSIRRRNTSKVEKNVK